MQYNMFFSIYSVPNIFLCLLAGYFVDKAGARVSLIVFNLLIFLGAIVFSISTLFNSYNLALIGRLLVG